MTIVDSDFRGTKEVSSALDLADDGLAKTWADVAGVFGLKELK